MPSLNCHQYADDLFSITNRATPSSRRRSIRSVMENIGELEFYEITRYLLEALGLEFVEWDSNGLERRARWAERNMRRLIRFRQAWEYVLV